MPFLVAGFAAPRATARGCQPRRGVRGGYRAVTHPALHTALCDLAGVRYPIVQTGMGWVASAKLVSATANAGGLGIIAVGDDGPAPARRRDRARRRAAPIARSA